MRVGPNITEFLPRNEWSGPEPPSPLFDPGEVTMTPQAVDDMRYLDMHPGEILARHVSGVWRYDDHNTVSMNRANLRRGVVSVESTSIWRYRPKKGAKENYYYFHARTIDGHTKILSSLDLIV